MLYAGLVSKKNKYGVYQKKYIKIYDNSIINYSNENHQIIATDINDDNTRIKIILKSRILVFKLKDQLNKLKFISAIHKLANKKKFVNIKDQNIPGDVINNNQKENKHQIIWWLKMIFLLAFIYLLIIYCIPYSSEIILFLFNMQQVYIGIFIFLIIWTWLFFNAIKVIKNNNNNNNRPIIISKEELYNMLEKQILNKNKINEIIPQSIQHNPPPINYIDEIKILFPKLDQATKELNDLSKTDADGFILQSKTNKLTIYMKQQPHNKNLLPIFKSIGIISNFNANIVANYLYNIKNKIQYDSLFDDTSKVIVDCSKYKNMDQIYHDKKIRLAHHKFKSPLSIIKPRDFCLLTSMYQLDKNTYIISATSCITKLCPPNPKTHVRANTLLGGFIIKNINNGNDCQVTFIGSTNLNGNIPTKFKLFVLKRQSLIIDRVNELLNKY